MTTIKGTLSYGGLLNISRKLKDYAKSLTEKNEKFISLLMERGIKVAQERADAGTHQMGNYISFETEISGEKGTTVGVIVGTGQTFPSQWIDRDKTEHNDVVYPLSMLEFGSAGFALPPQEAFGGSGGQGAFSVAGHETDVWWYVTKVYPDGRVVRKLATAIAPTRPMYNAMLRMRHDLMECAKIAFGGGDK